MPSTELAVSCTVSAWSDVVRRISASDPLISSTESAIASMSLSVDSTVSVPVWTRSCVDRIDTVTSSVWSAMSSIISAISFARDWVSSASPFTSSATTLNPSPEPSARAASIEAARADGSGDGFSVVAEEVKGLAEETQSRANEIAEMIDDIADQTEEVTVSIRSTQERVQTGTDTVESTLSDIEAIADSVDEISGSLAEIRRTTSDQADTVQDTASSVDGITDLSTETAETAEQVAAEIEEGQSVVEAVSDSLREFQTDAVTTLQDRVAAFTVEEGESAPDAPAAGSGTPHSRATTDGGAR